MLLLIEWCCNHKYLQSDKYICCIFKISFLLTCVSSFLARRVSFSEFLSAISQKFKQESIEIYFPHGESIVFYICFFFILLLLFLYSTQKKVIVFVNAFYNIFSLSLGFKFSVCNLVSLSCLSRVCVLSHIIHNPGEEKEVFLQMMMCYHYQCCSHIDNFVALSLSVAGNQISDSDGRVLLVVCCYYWIGFFFSYASLNLLVDTSS